MIIKPGISTLAGYVDSRYTLVTMAAKRARMINENGTALVPCDIDKPVSIAVAEIAAGKVGYVRHDKNEVNINVETTDDFIQAANGNMIVDENGVVVE